MLPISYKLRQMRGYSLWLLGLDRALDMTAFVHGVYDRRFRGNPGWDAGAELMAMLEDDRDTLHDSIVVCAYDDRGQPLCTIKAIRKVSDLPLPVERDFGVDALRLLRQLDNPVADIFEIGRLAKDDRAAAAAGLDAKAIAGLGDQIVAAIIRFTARSLDNVWVASLDNAVLGLLRSRGYGFEAVGPSTFYLGSQTTPVMLPVRKWRQSQHRAAPQNAPAAVEYANLK